MKTSRSAELRKLNKIFKDISPEKKKVCEGLISDAAFMVEQLAVLREYISEHGWSEEYQNGASQKGKKASSEADMYIKLQKSYQTTIRQLICLLPEDSAADAAAELMSFVRK